MSWLKEHKRKKGALCGVDFSYRGIDYDYDGYNDCGSNHCNEEGICRCYTIDGVYITKLDFEDIKSSIIEAIDGSTDKQKEREKKLVSILGDKASYLDDYCIDRILRHYKVYDKNIWDIEYGPSYYGDEVDGVFLPDDIAIKIENDIRTFLKYRNIEDRVYALIFQEYNGYLEELYDKKFEIDVIETSKIKLGQREHADKVSTMDLNHYSSTNYKGIRGVVVDRGHYYKVVDGYHRITQAMNENVTRIEVIVAKDI